MDIEKDIKNINLDEIKLLNKEEIEELNFYDTAFYLEILNRLERIEQIQKDGATNG